MSEGKTASLVLVRANPLEDIRNAQQIESLFLRGQYFSREDLGACSRKQRDPVPSNLPAGSSDQAAVSHPLAQPPPN